MISKEEWDELQLLIPIKINKFEIGDYIEFVHIQYEINVAGIVEKIYKLESGIHTYIKFYGSDTCYITLDFKECNVLDGREYLLGKFNKEYLNYFNDNLNTDSKIILPENIKYLSENINHNLLGYYITIIRYLEKEVQYFSKKQIRNLNSMENIMNEFLEYIKNDYEYSDRTLEFKFEEFSKEDKRDNSWMLFNLNQAIKELEEKE